MDMGRGVFAGRRNFYATKTGIKTTEKKIQENMGDLLLVETPILPLGLKTYGL